jgi:hypothetical protein
LDRWNELKEVLRVKTRAEVAKILLDRELCTDMSEAKSIFIYFYASMDVKICVCLPRKYGHFMLFIDNNLLLPGARLHILNNIYRK